MPSPCHLLGISAYDHDAAAALLYDGRIVATAQEEHITRKKNDPDFPRRAIESCLRRAGLTPGQPDAVVFYDKPIVKFARSWRLRATACLTIALGFVAGSSIAQNASNEFWQAQSIYQIVTDRFFDGNAANNNADGNYNPANSGSVHGGDFQGIEQKLDYIKALGATAIWISPIVLNGHGQFHGYAGRDFYSVDPHWGTLSNLQHMVQAAHARGLLVIDDIICNHGDDLIYSTDSG